MSSVPSSLLVTWLRAAGEPSRLRLLALCAQAPFSVSDLAQTLRQSEPRISRHLKILCVAGLLERLRQGQWVQYRVSPSPEAMSFVRGLLAQLDRRDPQLQRDRAAARAVATPEDAGGSESRLGRALAALVSAGEPQRAVGQALIAGVAHPELLASIAGAARECTALVASRRAAQSARAFVERSGLRCRVLQASGEGVGSSDLARAGASFDVVLLDYADAAGESLARLLDEARRVLAPGGRLWIFEPYESLESSRERVVEHPLARLRRLLGAAGLVCERLRPVEADGEHVLAAMALLPARTQPLASASGAAP